MPGANLVLRLLYARHVSPLAAAVRYNLLSVVRRLISDISGLAECMRHDSLGIFSGELTSKVPAHPN